MKCQISRLAAIASAFAICPAVSAEIIVSPTSPVSTQSVSITLTQAYTSHATIVGASIVRIGNSFSISQTVDLGCLLPEAPILTSQFDVGFLAAGSYQVTAGILHTSSLPDCSLGLITQQASFQVTPANAGIGVGPSATLLFPYFEVDLDDPEGLTTLVAIGNALPEGVLAHVILWTDTGLPTLAFDLFLEADAISTLNLRQVLSGQLPGSGAAIADTKSTTKIGPPPSCVNPVALPEVDPEQLRARHTGQPDPIDGLCWGSGRAGSTVATGYLTVDVIHDCAEFPATPLDPGYFADGEEEGRASNLNALWGDYFYLAEGDNAAQGFGAVQIPAAPVFAEGRTFYFTYSGGADQRSPLGSSYRARYLVGGGFAASSEQIIWIEDLMAGTGGPSDCSQGPAPPAPPCSILEMDLFDEHGDSVGEQIRLLGEVLSFRATLGSEEIPLPEGTSLGFAEITHVGIFACGDILPSPIVPRQAWVTSVIRSQGRFSAGLPATRIE